MRLSMKVMYPDLPQNQFKKNKWEDLWIKKYWWFFLFLEMLKNKEFLRAWPDISIFCDFFFNMGAGPYTKSGSQ